MSYYGEYRAKYKYAATLKNLELIKFALEWCQENLGDRNYNSSDTWEYAFVIVAGVSVPVFFFDDEAAFIHVSLKWG